MNGDDDEVCQLFIQNSSSIIHFARILRVHSMKLIGVGGLLIHHQVQVIEAPNQL